MGKLYAFQLDQGYPTHMGLGLAFERRFDLNIQDPREVMGESCAEVSNSFHDLSASTNTSYF